MEHGTKFALIWTTMMDHSFATKLGFIITPWLMQKALLQSTANIDLDHHDEH